MTDKCYNQLLTRVKNATEIKRTCDCVYQHSRASLKGCEIFTKKPDECWNETTPEEKAERENQIDMRSGRAAQRG
jgi:hypothetical protein